MLFNKHMASNTLWKQSCSEPLIPVITNIINNSLESGIFPDSWKEAGT